MVLGDLVEAEQEHRSPREKDRVGHTTLDHIARLGCRGLHVGTAQHGHHLSDRALRRANLHALDVFRHHDLLLAVIRAGIVDEGEAEMRVLHLLCGMLAIPLVERRSALVGIGEGEGQLADRDDREAAGLVARVYVGHIGNAVAGHVVVVERLSELFGRKDGALDRAVGRLCDRIGPLLGGRDQRMGRRQPDRDLQVDGLVLRHRRRATKSRSQRQSGHCQHRDPGDLLHWAFLRYSFGPKTYRAMTAAPTRFIAAAQWKTPRSPPARPPWKS